MYKVQAQAVKGAGIYPQLPVLFPMTNSMCHFASPLYLTTSLLQLLNFIDSLWKMVDL
jgi:hypothetical protein